MLDYFASLLNWLFSLVLWAGLSWEKVVSSNCHLLPHFPWYFARRAIVFLSSRRNFTNMMLLLKTWSGEVGGKFSKREITCFLLLNYINRALQNGVWLSVWAADLQPRLHSGVEVWPTSFPLIFVTFTQNKEFTIGRALTDRNIRLFRLTG